MRGRDAEAYRRFEQAVEWPMLVLAMLFGVALVWPLVAVPGPRTRGVLDASLWFIWAAFVVEYVVLLYLAPDRARFARTHVLDDLVIAVPFTSFGDALWWAFVTSTTVGYGDVTPVSNEGRGVAVVLMLVGIGLFSVITANVAAFFVEEEDEAEDTALRERLTRMEQVLEALAADRGVHVHELDHRSSHRFDDGTA